MSGNKSSRGFYPDGTASVLYTLQQHPTTDVRCSLAEGSPAVAIFYTPQGCQVRPGDKIQALCLQHMVTGGTSAGTRPLLDLTIGEAWSKESGHGELPLRLGFSRSQLEQVLRTLPGV